MTILVCHAFYSEPGGEDASFLGEAALLERQGHRVLRLTANNRDAAGRPGMLVAARALWNRAAYREARAIIRRERPDIVHCTNTFPTLSPSLYYAARAEGVPVVQSLRNYRLWCANATLVQRGRTCDDCLRSPLPWRGVLRGCYRGSRAASLASVATTAAHRALGTYARLVDLYISPSAFARRKAIEGGLPADRVIVKPNFVDPDPGARPGGEPAVFVGRLSPEKGLAVLFDAWSRVAGAHRLVIVGDGPDAPLVRLACARDPRIAWAGRRDRHAVFTLLGQSACLVMPSVCPETFGRSVVEAFSVGTPAIVSSGGAVAELVDPGRTGFLFEPGNAADLAAVLARFFQAPRSERTAMRHAARREYERRFTAEDNYRQLMAAYGRARERGLRGAA